MSAVALDLHGMYAGLERLFEIVARSIDRFLPSGAHWHQELLEQMAVEVRGTRPAVLTLALMHSLDEYRKFRHVVRSVYSFDLDFETVEQLAQRFSPLFAEVRAAFLSFADLLDIAGAE